MTFTTDQREKLNGRNAFLFPFFLYKILDRMEYSEEGATLGAIRNYVRTGEVKEFPTDYILASVALDQFIEFYDEEARKYLKKCDVNQRNASQSHKNRTTDNEQNKHPTYG